jgi:hypothetical protein
MKFKSNCRLPLILLAVSVFITSGWDGCGTMESSTRGPSIQGQLVDRQGRPASQYPIEIERTDVASTHAVAYTDFSGTFQFFNLEPGKYKIYPSKAPSDSARAVDFNGSPLSEMIVLTLPNAIKVEMNREAAQTINSQAAQTINPEAAQTVNPEAARTLNPEAAKTLNPEAARTINMQAAQTINPAAARTINADAARTINPEAAYTINPDAAKVLNPERAKFLTKEEAKTLTIEIASKPPAASSKAPGT